VCIKARCTEGSQLACTSRTQSMPRGTALGRVNSCWKAMWCLTIYAGSEDFSRCTDTQEAGTRLDPKDRDALALDMFDVPDLD
jgi:hypothetical protein